MPYFCVVCGAFQRGDSRSCPACGAEREEAARIDPFERTSRVAATTDDEPEEVVSRRRYLWFKLTRPWRRLWRRGFLWRSMLIAGSAVFVGAPLTAAIYLLVPERCDASQDVACAAEVVRLVTPVSSEFADRLGGDTDPRNLALAAEVYDAVALLGLAWLNDGSASSTEITRVSGGDVDICDSIVECAELIRRGVNVDYDGVSGSVYLGRDGVRGSYIANRRTDAPSTDESTIDTERLIGRIPLNRRTSTSEVAGQRISVLTQSERPAIAAAAFLAATDLGRSGISLTVDTIVREVADLERLGEFVVVVDDAIPDRVIDAITRSDRIVIAVGSEWRTYNSWNRWLRVSATQELLAQLVVPRLDPRRDVIVVGRCGDSSQTLERALKRNLESRGYATLTRHECINREKLASPVPLSVDESPVMLVVASSNNPVGLLRTMLESGYGSDVYEVIIVAPRVVRLAEQDSTQP